MKEKILERIEEVKIYGELNDRLDSLAADVERDIEGYEQALVVFSPEERSEDWRIVKIEELKRKLKAIDFVRSVLFKVMG